MLDSAIVFMVCWTVIGAICTFSVPMRWWFLKKVVFFVWMFGVGPVGWGVALAFISAAHDDSSLYDRDMP